MQPEVYVEMAAVQELHWWFVARRQILAKTIETLGLSRQSSILEIGCGTGGNLAMLAKFGQLRAIESDDTARAIANALDICEVQSGGLPDPITCEDGGFDLVCLLDVLEHIDDDRASLARVGKLIKPDGHILITVPAYNWLWSRHDEAHHHKRRYSAGTLRQVANEASLSVLRIGYYNTLLFPLIASARLAGKAWGGAKGSNASLPPKPLNSALRTLFALESNIVPRALFPFGTSVLALMTQMR